MTTFYTHPELPQAEGEGNKVMEWKDISSIATPIVGLLGVGVAFFAVWYQVKNQRRALGVEVLLKLADTFFKDMKGDRCAAASVIPIGRWEVWNGEKGEVENVLDFFDFVGALVRKGVLDKEMVWHTFFHCLHGYYDRAQDHIKEYQQKTPDVWEDLCWLYKALVKVERGKRGEIDTTEWANFVDEEKTCCT